MKIKNILLIEQRKLSNSQIKLFRSIRKSYKIKLFILLLITWFVYNINRNQRDKYHCKTTFKRIVLLHELPIVIYEGTGIE